MWKYELSDAACFAGAYAEYRDLAFAAANGVLRDAAAAEDVVQDVFLHIWSRPRSFDPDRAPLGTYIAVLARSRAIDQWRSRQARDAALTRAAAAEQRPGDAPDTTADAVIRSDLRAHALHAVAQLPDRQREALLLSYGRGLTVREVAGITGAPLGTAKSRVRLGLRGARALLEPTG
jgi:RNA polymerase sigma-70 factor (ECF subfamily)